MALNPLDSEQLRNIPDSQESREVLRAPEHPTPIEISDSERETAVNADFPKFVDSAPVVADMPLETSEQEKAKADPLGGKPAKEWINWLLANPNSAADNAHNVIESLGVSMDENQRE